MSAVLETQPKTRTDYTKRKYSDEFKAHALLILETNGGNLLKTSTALEIPIKTLQDWRDGAGVVPEVALIRNNQRIPLAQRLEDLAHYALDLLPGKMPSASVRDLVGVYAQSIEKNQLLLGRPTQITDVSVSIDDRRDALAAAFFAQQRQLAGKCSDESELNAVDCVEGELCDVSPVTIAMPESDPE